MQLDLNLGFKGSVFFLLQSQPSNSVNQLQQAPDRECFFSFFCSQLQARPHLVIVRCVMTCYSETAESCTEEVT